MRTKTLLTGCTLITACAIHAFGCNQTATKADDNPSTTPDGSAPDGGGSPGSPEGGGSNNDPASSCSTGMLFAGSVTYTGDPTAVPNSGTGILADPPLDWNFLAFAGSQLYTNNLGELWTTDTSAANPVETRIAGLNSGQYDFKAGPCAEARLGRIRGLAALNDGSLIVGDDVGNALVHVSNPLDASCTVEYWAGNRTPLTNINITKDTPGAGDKDGAGEVAQFNAVRSLTTDGADNVYFYDRGNRKIKRMANDAAHTVTTVAALGNDGPDHLHAFTWLNGTLYTVGTNSANAAFVLSVDVATGAFKTVKTGRFEPVEETQLAQIQALTTDGHGLILTGNGYLWYLTPAGELTHIAGRGRVTDFPPAGYDPSAPHPAKEIVLRPGTTLEGNTSDNLIYHDGAVYYRGTAQNSSVNANYIEKISCP